MNLLDSLHSSTAIATAVNTTFRVPALSLYRLMLLTLHKNPRLALDWVVLFGTPCLTHQLGHRALSLCPYRGGKDGHYLDVLLASSPEWATPTTRSRQARDQRPETLQKGAFKHLVCSSRVAARFWPALPQEIRMTYYKHQVVCSSIHILFPSSQHSLVALHVLDFYLRDLRSYGCVRPLALRPSFFSVWNSGTILVRSSSWSAPWLSGNTILLYPTRSRL
jgi:hypothetical protein